MNRFPASNPAAAHVVLRSTVALVFLSHTLTRMLADPRLVAPVFIVQMLFGIYLVHMKNGWFVVGHGLNGMEFSVTLVAALLAIMLTAPAPVKTDHAGFLVALLLALPAAAHDGPAPNRVDISPLLLTSGQPTKAFLETLKEQGYEAVVYLAPPTVGDALAEEPRIVGRQGLVYVNIPIVWESPIAADFQQFTRVMQSLDGRKVYVHCQMNLRASSMVFLHRVITLKEPPEKAWESVQRAWVPNATWKKYILATMKANGVAYEPF